MWANSLPAGNWQGIFFFFRGWWQGIFGGVQRERKKRKKEIEWFTRRREGAEISLVVAVWLSLEGARAGGFFMCFAPPPQPPFLGFARNERKVEDGRLLFSSRSLSR